MDNKKLGALVLGIAAILLIIFIFVFRSLTQQADILGCFPNQGCTRIETSITMVHFAFGIFGFLFALGFYLLLFTKGEEAIVKRLEADSSRKLNEEKLSLIMKGLDGFEQQVLNAVKEQDGITQSTLRLRVDMSKAKLSQVLSGLEKKGLVKREPQGKSLAVYLKEKFEK